MFFSRDKRNVSIFLWCITEMLQTLFLRVCVSIFMNCYRVCAYAWFHFNLPSCATLCIYHLKLDAWNQWIGWMLNFLLFFFRVFNLYWYFFHTFFPFSFISFFYFHNLRDLNSSNILYKGFLGVEPSP